MKEEMGEDMEKGIKQSMRRRRKEALRVVKGTWGKAEHETDHVAPLVLCFLLHLPYISHE